MSLRTKYIIASVLVFVLCWLFIGYENPDNYFLQSDSLFIKKEPTMKLVFSSPLKDNEEWAFNELPTDLRQKEMDYRKYVTQDSGFFPVILLQLLLSLLAVVFIKKDVALSKAALHFVICAPLTFLMIAAALFLEKPIYFILALLLAFVTGYYILKRITRTKKTVK